MEDSIDVELLISLVKQRPVLWDKTMKDYHNRAQKSEAWEGVCVELNTDFKSLEDKSKNIYCKFVLKRWRNIRDQWLKSCKKMEDIKKSGAGTIKIRKYVYHKQLTFLKKTTEIDKSNLSYSLAQEESEDFSSSEEIAADSYVSPKTKKPRLKIIAETTAKDKQVINTFGKSALKEDNDPRLLFLRSLLPHIKDFSNDEFLQVQCGFLQVIQDIKLESSSKRQLLARGAMDWPERSESDCSG